MGYVSGIDIKKPVVVKLIKQYSYWKKNYLHLIIFKKMSDLIYDK